LRLLPLFRYKNSIGGSQSIRRFTIERKTPAGGWEPLRAMLEHAHLNWGATILVEGEGRIQVMMIMMMMIMIMIMIMIYMYDGGDETLRAMLEHAHLNWGATILVEGEGRIQVGGGGGGGWRGR
jgi:hypothetical protein